MNTFGKLGINKDLETKLNNRYIVTPTPIQVKSIPLLLENNTKLEVSRHYLSGFKNY